MQGLSLMHFYPFLFGEAERLVHVVREHNKSCCGWICLISKFGRASSCSATLWYDHSGITNTFFWHEETEYIFFLILQRRYIYLHWYYKPWPPFRVPSHNGICNFSSFIRPVEYQVRISEEISVSNCNLLTECRRKCVLNENLQSRQVKRTPQDSILNDLIIWKMNPLVVPVTSVKFKSALLHA